MFVRHAKAPDEYECCPPSTFKFAGIHISAHFPIARQTNALAESSLILWNASLIRGLQQANSCIVGWSSSEGVS
jgi:hypothetical protein